MDDQSPQSTTSNAPAAPQPAPNKKKNNGVLLTVLALVIGLGLGYGIRALTAKSPVKETVTNQQSSESKNVDEELKLPTEAVQIQKCANNRGALYAKPADIPLGPVYMVHQDKVIGIQFMLDKEEFLAEKTYKHIAAHNIKVNHANIGALSKGHEGYTKPHYHVDLYTVAPEVEQAITCPAS